MKSVCFAIIDASDGEFELCAECAPFVGLALDALEADDAEPVFECARCGELFVSVDEEPSEPEEDDYDGSCTTCGGSGGGPDEALYCPMCGGTGRDREYARRRYEQDEPDEPYEDPDGWQDAQDRYDRMIYGP